MSEVESANSNFKDFIDEITKLNSTLENLKKFKSVGELEEKVSLVDYAQLNATMAYSLNSLYYSNQFYDDRIPLNAFSVYEDKWHFI